jgi:hypothetical protein
MDIDNIKTIWHSYDAKLEISLRLNKQFLDMIQRQNIEAKVSPLLRHRIIELVFHGAAIILLTAFLVTNISEWRYALSAIALLVFYIVAFAGCVKQILVLKNLDYSNDIVSIQSSLVMLQTHALNSARLAVLCMPAFLAYPMVVSKAIQDLGLNALSFMDIRANYDGDWWQIQLVVTLLMVPLCALFYQQVSYRNIHKDWVKRFIRTTSGTRIMKAIELAKELHDLKKEAYDTFERASPM